MDGDPQPSWLREPCPEWCTRRHDEVDHPEDRFHRSAPTILPILAAPSTASVDPEALHATEVVVWRARHIGSRRDWVAVEEVEGPGIRLALSLESATSLGSTLGDLADDGR